MHRRELYGTDFLNSTKVGTSKEELFAGLKELLKKNNIGVTIRREFGSKVNAACGQLRSHYEEV